MKNLRIIIAIISLLTLGNVAFGQAFTKNDPIGTYIEYQKGTKETNIERMTLVDKKETSKGTELYVQIDDEKELIMKFILQNDQLSLDLNSMMYYLEKSTKESLDNNDAPKINFTVKGDPISIPLRPTLYATYPKINFQVHVKILMLRPKVRFAIYDREIIDTEVVDTPMGKHTAFIYRSRWEMRLRFLGLVNEHENFEMLQWIVPGIGVVKEATIAEGEKLSEENTEVLIKKVLPSKS